MQILSMFKRRLPGELTRHRLVIGLVIAALALRVAGRKDGERAKRRSIVHILLSMFKRQLPGELTRDRLVAALAARTARKKAGEAQADQPEDETPPGLKRYALIAGMVGAFTLLATTFPILALVQIGADTGVGVGTTLTMMAIAGGVQAVIMAARLKFKIARATRRSIVITGLATGVSYAVLGGFPSAVVLAVMVLVSALFSRAAGPLRYEPSQRFPDFAARGQQMIGKVFAWTYTLAQTMLGGVVWIFGWRWAAGLFAVVLIGAALLPYLIEDFPEHRTPPEDERSWQKLFDLPAFVLALVTSVSGVVLFELLFALIQPRLVDLGMGVGLAALAVSVIGGGPRLYSQRFVKRYATLADYRMPLATLISGRWLMVSGLCALATQLPGGLWTVVAIVGAVVALEIGQNSVGAALGGYLGRLSPYGPTIASLSTMIARSVGGGSAPLLSWNHAMWVWAGIAAVLYALTWILRWRPQRQYGLPQDLAGAEEMVIEMTPPDKEELMLLQIDDLVPLEVRDGDSLVIASPWVKGDKDPRGRESREAKLWVTYLRNPKPVGYQPRFGPRWPVEGRLRRRGLRRAPLVASDGKVYGHVAWYGEPGTWEVRQVEGRPPVLVLRSVTNQLERTVRLRHHTY